MPVMEIVDPNNNVNGRGSASRTLRTRGFAQADGDTAIIAVTLTDESGNAVSLSGGGGGSSGSQATAYASIATAASSGAAKNSAGVLYGILVTTLGSTAVTITDGPSGAPIGYIPASHPPGDLAMYTARPFFTSLYYNTGSGTPAFTLFYA